MNDLSVRPRAPNMSRVLPGCQLLGSAEEQVYEAMENVIKQGYLRKAFPSDRGLTGLLDKLDPTKWFVLLVRGGTPFLEYYDKQNDVFSSEPVNSFELTTCKQVTFTFLRNARVHTFNIILEDRVIELASTSRELMISWCDSIENTLQRLGMYKKDNHDHVYSFCPAVVNLGGPKEDGEGEGEADTQAPEGAAADYSVPDEYIFGTVGEIEEKEEKLKEKEKKGDDDLARKESVEEDSDYSGDFVGKEFFLRNRIKPTDKKGNCLGRAMVKSDRHSVLGLMPTPKRVEDSNNNSFNPRACEFDESLDDGYSELLCRKQTSLQSEAAAACASSSSSHIKQQTSSHGDLSKEKLTVDLPQQVCESNDTCVKSVSSGAATSSCSGQGSSSCASTNQREENMYSDFPCPQDTIINPSISFSETSPKVVNSLASRPIVASPDVKPIPKKRTSVLQKAKPFANWETFESDLPMPVPVIPPPMRAPPRKQPDPQGAASNGTPSIPPLPPRFDSLALSSVSMDETVLKQTHQAPIMSQSACEASVSEEFMPPLPPKRDSQRGARSASTSDIPPPVPARKSQSFRIQRPITSPPNMVDAVNGVERVNEREAHTAPRRPDRQLSMRMRMERGQSAHTVISLKHNQVDILMGEILSAAVAKEVPQKSGPGLALVDIQKKVWIAGWNWKDYPGLHSKFHVGDQVLSINMAPVESAAVAMKMLKHAQGPSEVVVRRLPHAKVMEIRREAEGQSLGIKREGGTGEIIYVDPNGLAATNGLPQRAESVTMPGLITSWYFTEINSRPVGLFFKNLEIEHRLNAVGLEISFVVQPSDFIIEMKKQLQKKIKNYKNFLPQ